MSVQDNAKWGTDMSNDNHINPLDYKEAIMVQDACNLSGVVHSFSAIMEKLSAEAFDKHLGTDWKNKHPIAVLYASKIASLTGCESMVNFQEAYDKCKRNAP